MVVPPPLLIFRLILRSEQQRIPHELGVVQHRPSTGREDLVVPVHHHAFPTHIHCIVVDILLHVHRISLQLSLTLGIPLLQQVLVHQLHQEKIPALLDIGDPRLPEKLQKVDLPDVDIPQPVLLLVVPENAVGGGPVLQLFPPVIRVGLFIVVILQDHRQYGGKHFGAALIAPLPGQHHRLGVIVHGVRVLIENGVEKPGRRRLRPRLGGASLSPPDDFPVPQLPPQFVLDDPLLQVPLALLVAVQDLNGPGHFLLTDPGFSLGPGQQRHFQFRGGNAPTVSLYSRYSHAASVLLRLLPWVRFSFSKDHFVSSFCFPVFCFHKLPPAGLRSFS